jgi:hypothetical protein
MTDVAQAPDWKLLRKIARELGVSDKAFFKWRERGRVPHKWRIPIIRHSGGYVSLSSFDAISEDER